MALLAFCDVESTGLEPERNEVWEVALILRDGDKRTEYLWHLGVDLAKADPMALSISRYYERHASNRPDGPRNPHIPYGGGLPTLTSAHALAPIFARLTHGAHLVGAVPSFDDAFLKRLLASNGACWGLHYHIVDVEALGFGYLAAIGNPSVMDGRYEPPWNSSGLTAALGLKIDEATKHTAMGDALWAEAIYDRVMGLA